MKKTFFLLITFVTICVTTSTYAQESYKAEAKKMAKLGWTPEPGMPTIAEQLQTVAETKDNPELSENVTEFTAEGETLGEAYEKAYILAMTEGLNNSHVEIMFSSENNMTNDSVEISTLINPQSTILHQYCSGNGKEKDSYSRNTLIKFNSKVFDISEGGKHLFTKEGSVNTDKAKKLLSIYRILPNKHIECHVIIYNKYIAIIEKKE